MFIRNGGDVVVVGLHTVPWDEIVVGVNFSAINTWPNNMSAWNAN